MLKLLSILSIILAIVLFPPAALALISNNAIPGDATYSIKRTLEDGIYVVVSLNSTTKAWFAAARSDRRFKEFTTLVAQGKKGEETLNELVEQTQVAERQIAQVADVNQKQKLVQQLSDSIQKYDQGLQQLSTSSSENLAVVEQTAPVPQITATPMESGSSSQPKPTVAPIIQPSPNSVSVPRPALTPAPAGASLIPTPAPTSIPVLRPVDTSNQGQIDEARRQLEEIRRRLAEQQSQSNSEHSSQNEGASQQNRQENKQNNKKEESKDKSKKSKD